MNYACVCGYVYMLDKRLKSVQKDMKESGDLCSSPYPAVDLAG